MHFSLVAIVNSLPASVDLWDSLTKMLEPFRDIEHPTEVEQKCMSCFPGVWRLEGKARDEADLRFGTCLELANCFKSTDHPPRPELPDLADTEMEVETKWRDYENWAKSWSQFIHERMEWQERRTAELVAGLNADPQCRACHGTGIILQGFEGRKWDYWTSESRERGLMWLWRQAIQRHPHVAAGFSQDVVRLSEHDDEAAIKGRLMRYLVVHERASIASAVLSSKGTWCESKPGIWGIAHLRPEYEKFPIYAEDEFWPLRFRSIIEENAKDDHVCIDVDCHH